MRRSAAVAVAIACALPSARARAEEAAVTLLRARRAGAIANEATARLAGELLAAGFTVRTVTASGEDVRAEVERVDGSFATIAIVPTPRGAAADVWVADRVTGKTIVRRVDITDPSAPNAASDLAIRGVELLRASLLEARARPPDKPLPAPIARFAEAAPRAPAPPPTDAPPAPAPPASPPAPPPRAPPIDATPPPSTEPPRGPSVGVEAAAAMLAGVEGGPSFRPLLRVTIDLPRGLSLRATVSPSVAPTTLTAPEGDVAFRQSFASLDVAYTFLAPGARVRPSLALGAGAYEVRADGAAEPGFRAQHQHAASALVAAGAGALVRLGAGLSLRTELAALVLIPGQTVSAVGQPLANLGRPALLPSIGLVAEID